MSALPTLRQYDPANPDYADVVRASFARQGLLMGLGAQLVHVGPGTASIALPFSDGVGQQQGFFHGAAMGAIGDVAGGYAALSLMAAESEVVTVEYKANFLRPAKAAWLIATGDVLRAGRSLTVCQVNVAISDAEPEANTRPRATQSGTLVAILQGTFSRVHLNKNASG